MLHKFHGLKKSRKAALVAVGLSLSFALMGVWVRMMQNSFDPFQQSYLRILFAGLIALVVFRRRLNPKLLSSLSRYEWTIYALRAFIAYVLGVAVFTIAIQNADLSVVSFISSLPMLGLLAFILFREKLPIASLPFLGLSVIGVLFLTGVNFDNFHLGIGEIASIIAALGFNLGFLMTRFHKKERNNFEHTTILLLLGWIPVFIISVTLGEAIIPTHISLTAFIGLLLAAFFNIIGLYATNYIFANLKAYVAGNILLLEGIWASCIGLLFYAEPVTAAIATGGLLIVGSAIMVNKIDNKDEEAQTTPLNESSSTPALATESRD